MGLLDRFRALQHDADAETLHDDPMPPPIPTLPEELAALRDAFFDFTSFDTELQIVVSESQLLILEAQEALAQGRAPRDWNRRSKESERARNVAYGRLETSLVVLAQRFDQTRASFEAASPDERADVLDSIRGLIPAGAFRLEVRVSDDVLDIRPYAVALLGLSFEEAEELTLRLEHVGAQVVERPMTLEHAIEHKQLLEAQGWTVTLRESAGCARDTTRTPIPENARHEVWRRDGGCCVDCGSRERLEFDHIIPLSRGGSSTTRNLELRCERCNRQKGATI